MPIQLLEEQDEVPLFYSDIMPLLVDNDPSVGEDAFAWLGSIVPLASDVVNGRFTFESLTVSSANRLHFPAYDKFLKEIDKYVKYLQKQTTPKGVELADDEFILHVEGTSGTQRVVRHIGGTSWPGRLTLTNYALYFEASGIITYEDALKIDLAKDINHSMKPAATGPFGAPIFDKAIIYESPEKSEGIVLEFPELTSSTRRDHWLALIKEIVLLHRFLSKFEVDSPVLAWEMHARTILGIIRLHAAREMLRIALPIPNNFLIFTLFDGLPKGDYVLEELAQSLKQVNTVHPCSASSILRSLNVFQQMVPIIELKEDDGGSASVSDQQENLASLDNTVNQVREEAKEVYIAKATVEGLKEEGVGDSVYVLMELLSPLKSALPWIEDVVKWKRPATTLCVIVVTLIITYKEWAGKALAAILLLLVGKMLRARKRRVRDNCKEIVVCTASDQTIMESIVSAQHGLRSFRDIVQNTNITILKIRSIFVSRTTKHGNIIMAVMVGMAVLLAVIPLKFMIMGFTLYYAAMKSKLGKYMQNEQADRRMKEWWDSIPVVPVQTVDKLPESPK